MSLDPESEKRVAIDLFNLVWKFLDKPDRSDAENDTMLHAAHASRYHWGQVGEPVNLARGEWQVSRVYAVLQRAEPAIFHAKRCLEICQQNGIADFDLAYAYEALARGSVVALEWQAVKEYVDLANLAGQNIREKDDQEWFQKDMATILLPPTE